MYKKLFFILIFCVIFVANSFSVYALSVPETKLSNPFENQVELSAEELYLQLINGIIGLVLIIAIIVLPILYFCNRKAKKK